MQNKNIISPDLTVPPVGVIHTIKWAAQDRKMLVKFMDCKRIDRFAYKTNLHWKNYLVCENSMSTFGHI